MYDIFWEGIAAGGCGGLARAVLGFLGNKAKQSFSISKFLRTLLLNILIGGVVGFLSGDVEKAIIGGLIGEEAIKSITKATVESGKK